MMNLSKDWSGGYKEVKANEALRREYMLANTIERDARNDGWKAGVAQGLAEGSRQKALETAKILKQFGDSVQKIMQVTGLSKEEAENA